MIELRFAKGPELPEAEELWSFAFGDAPAFQRKFYDLCAPEGPLVVLEDGGLRAMLALPEVILRFGDGWPVRTGYIYALATRPGHGGRGWASMLLGRAASLGRERGLDCLLTVPARPDLFGFFEKNGFVPGFYHREAEFQPEPAPAEPVSPAEYSALREELLAGRTHVAYSEGQIAFQQAMGEWCAGGLYRLALPHGPGCAAVEGLNHPVVKELLCAPEDEAQGAAACAALCGSPARVRIPAGPEDGQPFGAIRWLFSAPPSRWRERPAGYLGLAFD